MPDRYAARAAIALGSNLGDREGNLQAAVDAVGSLGEVLAVSGFRDTTPVGYVEQPRFLNGALLLQTSLSPEALLEALLAIELRMGRNRAGVPAKGPRIIDLDLIFYDDLILQTAELTLPHPSMHERGFVLEPLSEIAPEWIHPVLGVSVLRLVGDGMAKSSRGLSVTLSKKLSDEQLGTLPTEARNARSAKIDELSTLDMLRVFNDEDALVSAAVRAVLPQVASVVDAVAERFARGGRLFYVGAGTSGRLGVLDASECPPTFSVSPGLFVGLIAGGDSALRKSSESSEDSPEAGARDLEAYLLGEQDTVIGIAASGRTPYVLGALGHARNCGSLAVALTCAGGADRPSRIAAAAELAIEVATGPEVLTGSTRMKAGTATKLVLNMISTSVMIRQGAVFGNLMVDVQPTNAKLVDRAERIIAEATGCERFEAAGLLKRGGSVKNAIVMQVFGAGRAEAEALLERSGGRLREALRRVD